MTAADILFVDDDPVIQKIYQDGLRRNGYGVRVAGDGMAALQAAKARIPDLMVLDLMMPRLNGADTLKFLRQQPALASVPVVILSNSYLHGLTSAAAQHGVERALLKVSCTPKALAGVIGEILDDRPAEERPPSLTSLPAPGVAAEILPKKSAETPSRRKPSRPLADCASLETHLLVKSQDPDESLAAEVANRSPRAEFLKAAPEHCETLQRLVCRCMETTSAAEKTVRLNELYVKVHFLTAMAGLAELPVIGQMSSALEALLFDIMNRSADYGPSVMASLGSAGAFLERLIEQAPLPERVRMSGRERVLVVDEDRLMNRLVVAALKQANLEAAGADHPLLALDWARQRRFDLVLLDVAMPDMDGFTFCEKLRQVSGYETTPVIYVTGHADFAMRQRSIRSGGNDLIAKPVLPGELAVKSVMHLLKARLSTS